MFASMFKSLFNKSDKKKRDELKLDNFVKITRKDVEELLTNLDEIKTNSDNGGNNLTLKDSVVEAIDSLSIIDIDLEDPSDDCRADNIDDSKSDVSSIGEIKPVFVETSDDPNKKKIINQINSLQCLFTWQLKPNCNKNMILWIENRYGDYNLNISLPEFTFERYIGNLIIGYEMFHKGKSESAQMKILEIGKWLEDLDNGIDEFYLSIKVGLKHVMTATFIHMLFATNLTGECKWLLDDIVHVANMDPRSRATVHAIRAAVLTEYGGNLIYYKKACECAKKACDLDPSTSYWFYIHSLALTAQRQFIQTHKSSPTDGEINAIQQAIMLSDGKNTLFNYHRMTLDRDTTIRNFHTNKNNKDKFMNANNLQENKTIVQMIKTIISMEPKDPHIVVKCARTLMTLPIMVRDFDLGKLYLTKALEMAPNDLTVLKAVTKTVEVYKKISNKSRYTTFEPKQNQLPPPLVKKAPNLGNDLRLIVQKYKNEEDPIPHLTNLVAKYNGFDRCKIISQICSYNLLFTNNLKNVVDQFIWLIEQPGVVNADLITQHLSRFGSKKFNLAELICNEIRLATNSSNTSSEDMLYYFKMLTKIMEKCDLKMNDVDPSMKSKLLLPHSSARSLCSNTNGQSENDFSDNESVNNKKVVSTRRNKNRKKHLQDTGNRVFTKKPEVGTSNKKTDYPPKNASKNIQNKTFQTNAYDIEQMNFKMSKFLNTSQANRNAPPIISNPLSLGNLRNIQTQAEIEQYTQQLYQNILSNTQKQFNLHNVNTQENNRFINQNQINLNTPFQQSPIQNPHPPPLLSLRPQISPQNQREWQRSKKVPPKKK